MTSVRGNRGWVAAMVAAMVMMLAAAIAAPAQTFTSLLSFDGTDGTDPYLGPLVQGTDGNLYGMTMNGGANLNAGTVFRVTPGGTLTSLYSFCGQPACADGASPFAGLVLGTDGNFYGTTAGGGTNGYGTVFKITPAGTLTVLYNFCSQPRCADGSLPTAGLVQGSDGAFYGTTDGGGPSGQGTVFRIFAGGTLTLLHSFDGTDGTSPSGVLIQGTDGSFYGITTYGGATTACGGFFLGCGTVFKITSGGTLTVLHSFKGNDGNWPIGGLIQGADGNFYGTTAEGGILSSGCPHGCGTVFKITPGGTLTTLHRFVNTDGRFPTSSLIQATDANFYGTAGSGGDLTCTSSGLGCGTIFKMTSSGVLTTLHSFNNIDGSNPAGGLVQATSGTLYGTTALGGTGACDFCGTIFSLALGLGPFVKTVPAGGKVGSSVMILGSKLEGATSVTFNGTAATFKVMSNTLISATVPAGATTGPVQVVKPGGTLTSSVNFRVQ